jgi:cobalt transporter subunit CbtA
MRVTPTASLATKPPVNQFRKLMLVTLFSGALAGLLLFVIQHFTVIPLIEAAETYETIPHADEGWQPADGWQRTSLTALATILSGIGFASILFGALALTGRPVSAARGALWGLAGFACFSVAPALGLPPLPPGVAVADLSARQVWWAGAVISTAAGLWLLTGHGRRWALRIGGAAFLLLPHLIGAPVATGENAVPAQLIRQFANASLATNGLFWLLLGTIGGFIYSRNESRGMRSHGRSCTKRPPENDRRASALRNSRLSPGSVG